jgi:transcription-repair coupling factor (superfamily II helicase)
MNHFSYYQSSHSSLGAQALSLIKALDTNPQVMIWVLPHERQLKQAYEWACFLSDDTVDVLSFSAWDNHPYDKALPDQKIMAKRLRTLYQLQQNNAAKTLVITTATAFIQTLPPVSFLQSCDLLTTKSYNEKTLQAFLATAGYQRVSTVYEPGDYAWRGGLLDIFSPAHKVCARVDFFGQTIDKIRLFDPVTQLTVDTTKKYTLISAHEYPLMGKTITQFRSAYRAHHPSPLSDGLYKHVSDGIATPDLVSFWPLLYKDRSVLLDWIPQGGTCVIAPEATVTMADRLGIYEDTYQSRAAYGPTLPPPYFVDKRLTKLDCQVPEKWLSVKASPLVDLSTACHQSDKATAVVAYLSKQVQTKTVVIAIAGDHGMARLTDGLPDGADQLIAIEAFGDCKPSSSRFYVASVPLDQGFITDDLCVVSEVDIFGTTAKRRVRRSKKFADLVESVTALTEGDLVVHIQQGIGRYEGLKTLDISKTYRQDCVCLCYQNDDRLYVPVTHLDMLSRYGSEDVNVPLDKLGTPQWQKRKQKNMARILEMAQKLVDIAAQRSLAKLPAIRPVDDLAYQQFCHRFQHVETDDQLAAIEDVLKDLSRGKPMDRLVCGDVGFGKTEVALRAAYVAAMAGFQVAVVVPTTLLARQHYKNFKQRFRGLSVRLAQSSRLVSATELKQVKKGLSEGTVDIVVGTHSLLSASVNFKNLGLIIVDEEQHFGVAQKERLKSLKSTVHILTLTATPIPRTLQLALSGVRDLSLIATPPVARLAVRTFSMMTERGAVVDLIRRERDRGGKVFYVCPRVSDLQVVLDRLTKWMPDLKVVVAHGGMSAGDLDKVMVSFVEGEYDLLLATHIIESGLDIATANTMIIYRAHLFGLSQLYQLRGRVGRGGVQAYCYLTWEADYVLSEAAQHRLHTLQTLDHLGAGFALANHDLDKRGAGNLVGDAQSGHVKDIGIELYQRLLEEAVTDIKDGNKEHAALIMPVIKADQTALIPDSYIPDLPLRVRFYRRLNQADSLGDQERVEAEMIDRFGALPTEAHDLMRLFHIKRQARRAHVDRVDLSAKGVTVGFYENTPLDPAKVMGLVQGNPHLFKLTPNQRLCAPQPCTDFEAQYDHALKVLKVLG